MNFTTRAATPTLPPTLAQYPCVFNVIQNPHALFFQRNYMHNISDYIRIQCDVQVPGSQAQIDHLQERSARHQMESDRLARLGDLRQAATHASIARTHAQLALQLSQPN